MQIEEVNFDGLVGQTHNYAGLSEDNVASSSNKNLKARPKEAALQGLKKMKFLADLGLTQAILPPQERPNIPFLKQFGFTGKDSDILEKARKQAPELFYASCSASCMWTANAATVTPAIDANDGKTHITPANLLSKIHRTIEGKATEKILSAIFCNETLFTVHAPIPLSFHLGDEGAANHTRLCPKHSQEGLHFLVYGRDQSWANNRKHFPRQTLLASEAIIRRHTVNNYIYAQQNPEAIDKGIFHNDVIATGNEDLYLLHEYAYINTESVIRELQDKYSVLHDKPLTCIIVKDKFISVEDAVKSYLFNSQIVTLPDNNMALIAPEECHTQGNIKQFIEELIKSKENRIQSVHYLDLKQSMRNGGGPACLRLRIPLTDKEISALPQGIFINNTSYDKFATWVNKHYRDELSSNDLSDPLLIQENRTALDELTGIMGLGSIYEFQQE
ncbi:MAG: N-succinylarginine dihydrolase [Verrucomicrobia bacterium CG_4_10_14_3_um_filter_43_23]|nr:MAG: N-succinylarginine dihydrolase [Verrucomicrobia bacterium CG1_02_43_26]PIP59525.1 MAG: N-succinylarginine dihydrolase [Verrucomicrobia bacterium CG22_combo_CG10-13_8_21_14_all_43_17]PIX58826.1 MAG: N-succinylarginine dihydrolase [Verrucomicrobia bacterium CG_4_10_14_3_um_filter_43_23]PIY60921.1 MAG: N-succinylarginine dihydrolase [Verrucomicrobia bacterium CG_4_10_14_0_8_um_filter_43_34]PJA44835.1 MAG: N-succinylarginine dihydrolase [Verrucomicrobia bacterium CG_4_9_14_3_um_filter_43_20